jgi:hypothetical protein
MKKLNLNLVLILLIAALILPSCANVEKLVDEGNYDAAINIAVNKMAGKKHKKEKFVLAAEEAFNKAMKRDMNRITALKASNRPENWEKIFTIAEAIERRQSKLEPFLPLLDKSGYKANFQFVHAAVIKTEAANKAAEYLYNLARTALETARDGDKIYARKAYEDFGRIARYFRHYKDADELQRTARNIGTSYLLIKVENESNQIIPKRLDQQIRSVGSVVDNSFWREIHAVAKPDIKYDYQAIVKVKSIRVTPEHVRETIHHFNKEIEETKYLRDRQGKIKKDSLGNKIEVIKKKRVKARVVEIEQHKEARINVLYQIIDAGGRIIEDETFQVFSGFDNHACRIFGNRKAVDKRWLNMGTPKPFPRNEMLILNAAEELKDRVIDELSRTPLII